MENRLANAYSEAFHSWPPRKEEAKETRDIVVVKILSVTDDILLRQLDIVYVVEKGGSLVPSAIAAEYLNSLRFEQLREFLGYHAIEKARPYRPPGGDVMALGSPSRTGHRAACCWPSAHLLLHLPLLPLLQARACASLARIFRQWISAEVALQVRAAQQKALVSRDDPPTDGRNGGADQARIDGPGRLPAGKIGPLRPELAGPAQRVRRFGKEGGPLHENAQNPRKQRVILVVTVKLRLTVPVRSKTVTYNRNILIRMCSHVTPRLDWDENQNKIL
ncbi:hypothetical protein AVEN_258336-1 [Araneus ventricosus]|uniref:Uncharacterized protein n=1 Tax=Araneus ventricosus TaxID=182803 RepID=A0A4Y2MQL2_ARAVE|nr:hypothetical protein AVEN_258336-1 [Araneus ventricosus]